MKKIYKPNTIVMLIIIALFSILPFFPQSLSVYAAESWTYEETTYEDLEGGNFNQIIWDDRYNRLQLFGHTLYEDFSSYNNINDISKNGWELAGASEPTNTASILRSGSNKELLLSRPEYYTMNLVARRNFSPTRRGEMEFIFTPLSGAARVALVHEPGINLKNGNYSEQFMFRFQPKTSGSGNEIRYGTNRGSNQKGIEYDIIDNGFQYGKQQHVRITWDLTQGRGVSVYLNGKLVVRNFFQDMTTNNFHFTSVSLVAGEGGSPLKGTPGRARYDFVSLKQLYNTSGVYTSKPIQMKLSGTKTLSDNVKLTWDQHVPNNTTVAMEARVSKNGGSTWSNWSKLGSDGSIPGLSRGDKVNSQTRIQYQLKLYSRQNNITPWVKDVKIQASFDDIAPSLNLTQTPTSWTNDVVTITATASDNVAVDYITLPNMTTVKNSIATYTVSNNGNYTFRATDTAGNHTSSSIQISNIDKSKPILNIIETSKNNSRVNIRLDYAD